MITLMSHQLALVDAARQRERQGIGWEPGLGKTIGTYAAINDARLRGFVGKTVVVCPKSIMRSAWEDDAKHFPDLRAVVCWASSAAKRRSLIATAGADVLILNYEAFKSHADDLLAAGVCRLVVDEASKLRNDRSAISQAAFAFSQHMRSVYLLSGTPAPNGPHEYFGLIRCIDPHVFGVNFWRFVHTYFCPIKRTIKGVDRITGWRLMPSAQELFMDKLQSVWWALRAQDCLDLPPETDVIRDVTMSAEEASAYVQVLEDLQAEFPDGQIIGIKAEAKMTKLRQITGGHLYGEDGAVRVIGRSKLDAMRELLEELGDRQLVIWAEFTAEIRAIVEELSDAGHSVARIDGSVDADDRARNIAAFQGGRVQYLVCHPAAAAHGITLTAARYSLFFSTGVFPENHTQARARIRRVGQRWPVTHFYLVASNTVDVKVLRVLRGKSTASEAVKELLVEGRKRERQCAV